MNICVSNLAWDEQDAMFEFLQNNSISRVESVFTKIKDWKHLKESDILAYKNKLQQYNLTAYSAQSLFYNVPCKLDDIEQILNHFERLLNYSDILSTKVLVFGSPSLRKQSGDWKQTLRRIFRVLDIMLAGSDIKVIIEPNAKYYGGEFFHTVSEIVEFIDDNEFDNILKICCLDLRQI